MGKLIVIVGNTGVGKTTLASQLCLRGDFLTGYEQHVERPFQQLFSKEHQRYALQNQIDYLLLRAEQELVVRRATKTGLQDGGLEMDYHVFCHHFFNKGYLDQAGFELCRRFYNLVRSILPPPDLIIRLSAPLTILAERFVERSRNLEIAALEDLGALEKLLDDWLIRQTASPLVAIDTSLVARNYATICDQLLDRIKKL